MTIFLRKFFLFGLVFGGIVLIILLVSAYYMNAAQFKIESHKNILVIGDSHTECAIDDSTFKRAANFSKSATSFVFTYAALRKLLKDNPQIDTVLLSYQSSSLSLQRERGWIFDETVMMKQVPAFLPYFGMEELRLFFAKPGFLKAALQMPWVALHYYSQNERARRQEWIDQNLGNFRDLTWSNFSRDTASTKSYAATNTKDTVSEIAIDYINKIANLCARKNITLILFNAPVYEWKTYVNYAEFEHNRKRYFSGIRYLNYAEFPIADSSRFDIHHLNGTGARQFSAYLEANLRKDCALQNAGK